MRSLRPLLLGLLVLLALPASSSAIVGGSVTQRDWPHMAGMEYLDPEDGEWGFRCGGSLIRADVILTAAHCVDDEESGGTLPASRFRFLLGTKKRSTGGERIGAVRIVEHPQYDASDATKSDVALVKLARPTTLGRPIRIAGPSDAAFWQPGDPSVVIGWGTEFFVSPTIPDDLKEAEIPIVSDTDCQNAYRFTLGFDPATYVCAGNLIGGEDSCQGDSGGPLHVQDATGAWIQVGVVSYGLGCAFPTQYGVYSEAGGDALRGWIAQNADALASDPAPPGAGTTAGSGSGTSGSSSTGAIGAAGSSTSALAIRTRLGLPSSLRRQGRRVAVTVTTTAPLRSLRVTLRRAGRTIADGRRAKLRSTRGRVWLKARSRRALRPGRVTVRVSAIAASGARVTTTRRARLR